MAYIEIISIPNGGAAAFDYFFREGVPGKVCRIKVGEVAYVKDSDIDFHIDGGVVRQISATAALGRVVNPDEAPRPGPKPAAAQ